MLKSQAAAAQAAMENARELTAMLRAANEAAVAKPLPAPAPVEVLVPPVVAANVEIAPQPATKFPVASKRLNPKTSSKKPKPAVTQSAPRMIPAATRPEAPAAKPSAVPRIFRPPF
jgi:hypothetical protein